VRNDFLMQFQADILGVPVVRPANVETTAAGAAYLAGLALDFYPSVEELSDMWQSEKVFEPRMNQSQREDLLAGWHRAVECAKNWLP
jgi:glycerol kinase